MVSSDFNKLRNHMSTSKEEARKKRIHLLESLYQMEFQDKPQETSPLIQEIQKRKEEIDILLKRYSQNWKLDRMALMDLSILRLAVYEIMFSQTQDSPKIFINEAIELSKIYGSSDSPKFINGILDSLAKKEGKLKT